MAEYTDKQLERMVYSKKYYRRAEAARHGVGLEVLVNDDDPNVRCAVAEQGYGLEKLLSDDSWIVKIAVAEQGYRLDILLNDRFPDTRAAARAYVIERLPESMRKVFETPLADIGLSQRIVNGLLPGSPGGLRTVGDLAMAPVERLEQFRGLGEKSLKNIKDAFTAFFNDRMAESLSDLTKEVEKIIRAKVDDSQWFMRVVCDELGKEHTKEDKCVNLRVFRNDDESCKQYGEVLKFWSNGIGELHDPHKVGLPDLTAEELPKELKRVYDELYWEPNGGASLRYFVETDKGYGIALLNEYDTVTAESSGVAFEQLFETVVADAQEIAKDSLLGKYEVFAGEFLGFDGCHELVVVVPWDTPVEEYVQASKQLDAFVYCGCELNKPEVSVEIEENVHKSFDEQIADTEMWKTGPAGRSVGRDSVERE